MHRPSVGLWILITYTEDFTFHGTQSCSVCLLHFRYTLVLSIVGRYFTSLSLSVYVWLPVLAK